MKWCWARLPGGVVTWEGYQGFRVGEKGEPAVLYWFGACLTRVRLALRKELFQHLHPSQYRIESSSSNH